MTFLKPEQVDTSLIEEEIQCVSLNAAVVETMNVDKDLAETIEAALGTDLQVGPYLNQIRDPQLPRNEDDIPFLEHFSFHPSGPLLRDGLIYIPDNEGIKVKILQTHHDARTAGHLGQAKTLELVSRDYYWPRMRQFVNQYIRSCDTCARNKAPQYQPYGLLRPLPIPPAPWSSVSMDYIVELPASDRYDAIYVCMDQFTKMAHFCATNSNITAEGTANLYLK